VAPAPLAKGASAQEIFIWNDSGADESSLQSIGQSLELNVRDGQLRDLGVQAAPGVMNGRDFATPISLAVCGMAPVLGTVDFLDSRLAPPPEKRVDRRTVAAVLVVLLLAAGAALWYSSIQKRQADVDAIVKENIDKNPQRSAAEATVKKIQLAQRWHGDKPKFVACSHRSHRGRPNYFRHLWHQFHPQGRCRRSAPARRSP